MNKVSVSIFAFFLLFGRVVCALGNASQVSEQNIFLELDISEVVFNRTDEVERANKLFLDEEILSYALDAIDQIVLINEKINNGVSDYKNGNKQLKGPIKEKINHILYNIVSEGNFPPSFNFHELSTLSSFLNSIALRYNGIIAFLEQEELKENERRCKIEKECDIKKSMLMCSEQNELDESPVFQDYLLRLKEKMKGNTYSSIYFAYAWPTVSRYEDECWVQPFLKKLQRHLKIAGFTNVKLDFVSNRYGANINEFMKGAANSNFVLLFGTESLLDKYEKGISAVCSEFIHILRKREADGKNSETKVFPIMIGGNFRNSLPPEYERFSTVRDWRCSSYLKNFQALFIELFGKPPEVFLPKLELMWEETLVNYKDRGISSLFPDWYEKQRQEIDRCHRHSDPETLSKIVTERVNQKFFGIPSPPEDFTGRTKEISALKKK